jgi:general secretion pathway protein G
MAHCTKIGSVRRCGNAQGFTLLELVIVMTILVVLASIGVVSYQQLRLKARETLLRQDLKSMREILDKYAADKEELPQTLDDVVSAGYMHDVPIDPMTGQADWTVVMGEDSLARDSSAKQGIIDVHSKADGVATDGKAYSEY